ncbi:MAG: GNAT family N-acetyltransferase [Bacteroidota bacterium]
MPSFKSFETKRLQLVPTVVEDAPFIYELMNTPKWLQFIGDRDIKNLEKAQTYIITKITPQLQRLGYSNYTVIRKMDGKKVGSCGLYDRNGLDGIDLGFAFLPEYEGQGYAFEAAHRLLQAAVQEFGLTHLSAITAKDNYASQKLLKKLKFKVADKVTLPNGFQELFLYTFKKMEGPE